MATQFKQVGIFGRVRNPGVVDTLKSLLTFLKNIHQDFSIESETAEPLHDMHFPTLSKHELSHQCDLLIIVGGDGSLLHAVHEVVHGPIPVLGINRGRLGFLTDILPSELNRIKRILDGDYIVEKRFLLSASVALQGRSLGTSNALNEVALIPDSLPHMSEFEVYIDNNFVCSQDSDGLIVATPTGSTAYALSGGGPILHPQLDAMVIVPMFPHSLNLRPIVIEGNHVITVVITPNNATSPRLSCDSQGFIQVPPGSHITINKRPEPLHLIHPSDYDYYETLRSKLHWGKKLNYTE